MKTYINKYIYVLSLLLIPLFVQCKSEVQYVDTKTVMADHSEEENGYKFKLGTKMIDDCTSGATFGDLTYLNPLPKEGVEPQAQIIKYDKCEVIQATLTRLKLDKTIIDHEIVVTATIDEITQKAKEYFCPAASATSTTVTDCDDAKYAASLLFVMAHTFSGDKGERQVKVGTETVTYEEAVYDMRTKGLEDKGIVYTFIPFVQMKEFNYTQYLSLRNDSEFDQLQVSNYYAKTWLSVLASHMIFNHLETECKEEEAVTTFDPNAGALDVEPATTTTEPKIKPPYCDKEMKEEQSPEPEVVSEPNIGDRMRVKEDTIVNVYKKSSDFVSNKGIPETQMSLVKTDTPPTKINTSDGELLRIKMIMSVGNEITVAGIATITGTDNKMVMFYFPSGGGAGYIHLNNLEKVTDSTDPVSL